MRACRNLILCWLLACTVFAISSYAKPLDDLSKTDTELSDLNAPPLAKNKTAARPINEKTSVSPSTELAQRAFLHRDEDQLNTATNFVLANNYKYDVEILESGDNDTDDDNDDDDRDDAKASGDLEERFRGHGIVNTDTDAFVDENIETSSDDVSSHMILTMSVLALAIISVGVYAVLVIWRAHLEARYGMRERLVNRDLDDDGHDENDYHVSYPHTLSPYAPTTITAATTTRA